MLTREGIRGAAKPEFSSLPSPPCKSSHCERSPPTPEKSHTNGAAAHAGLEAGAACARASAPNPLPPTCALPGGEARAPAGWREGAREAPSCLLRVCGGREPGQRLERSTRRENRGGGGGNLPSPAPVSILPLRRSIHEVSPPPRCSRRDPEPRGAASLPPEAGGGQKRFPLPPERGAAARAGAGNSRGLSGWRSPSGERSPAFLLPGPGGGVGHGEGLAARSGRVGGWVGGRRVSQLQPSRGRRPARTTAAAPPQAPGEPRAPQRPRSRPPPPWPSPPPSLTHPPGRPGPRPSRRSSSLSPHSAATRVLPPPPSASLAVSGASSPPPQALLSHTRARARARPGSLGRPLFSSPPHPPSPLNAAVGGGRRIDVPSASCSRRRGR